MSVQEDVFAVEVDSEYLGSIVGVDIGYAKRVKPGPKDSWYISSVAVEDLETGDSVTFFNSGWINSVFKRITLLQV